MNTIEKIKAQYEELKRRADDLYEVAQKNPGWGDLALDAEEELAIFAYEYETELFE